jgi:outer membrane protein assembly factor BamD (BamD/ComL family)
LAEQNDLFSSAIASEHRGDHATAIRKLDELIQRFPSGPLLESARVERQRILSVQSSR